MEVWAWEPIVPGTLKALAPGCCCLVAGFWWSVAIVDGSAKMKLKKGEQRKKKTELNDSRKREKQTNKPEQRAAASHQFRRCQCDGDGSTRPIYTSGLRGVPRCPAHWPVIGPVCPWSCPHPRGCPALLQSYFISSQFCAASHCSIST